MQFLILLIVCALVQYTYGKGTNFVNLSDDAKKDLIDTLPGGENLSEEKFGFSGYVAVNGTQPGSKQLHYWMAEAENDPENAPVAFWTNGGPGCSGLLGAMTEQGPYRPQKDGSLLKNPYNWNKDVNMVFIEQPCGVGFSYSTDAEANDGKSDDYKADDASAAKDNYFLIQGFMSRFPQLAKNPLYLTSESYGGHYLPTLAKYVVEQNKEGTYAQLNFKGFAVGNPATTFESTTPAMVDAWWGHQIISKPLYDKFMSKGCMSKEIFESLEDCELYFSQMYKQTSKLNAYALDYPVCLSSDEAQSKDVSVAHRRGQAGQLLRYIAKHILSKETRELLHLVQEVEVEGEKAVFPYEPCQDDWNTQYLNRDDVKQALHVKTSIQWSDCSRKVHYDEKEIMKSMTGYYKWLIENSDIDMLVYSGDDDSVCSTSGTQQWIYDLGVEPSRKNTWNPWLDNDGELAGFLTKFSKAPLSFMTVHGAGHEVPTYKPSQALLLFQKFLSREVFE